MTKSNVFWACVWVVLNATAATLSLKGWLTGMSIGAVVGVAIVAIALAEDKLNGRI